ncbi:tyrosine--tRNA ligase [Flammeovirga yaeyamensis]|uniref:Tyrosine--tRNA ligase n=1 Tax=Flammeovirga yaeyamensis TaxID=367791 RepID=A0AAX1N9S3_9BACT|nr:MULTISPECIES: tyrosine--tRNA ligase [Flammeovirga]ANQ50062.1 tyrosine--tRNA ligase [Flammeovirga sp. MY04]MBB3700418.1 tyrosyl-tRNA synthetase [Flammeovirga yaeyamensis]NMF36956.1 tyrosine--tRNA ligase [Flammeovirga yaeyamensis]QWG02498.1 tyrosine--tRNA ligase [Flammeovirga yaeyamensis]
MADIKTNLIEELQWRGMLHDIMPGTEDQLNKEMTTAYVGFDPTADSLHIGHMVSVMLLRHLQKAGHKPLAIVGGATGMIGDPSFKDAERQLLDDDTIQKNIAGMKAQLEKFLDFDCGDNSAEILNNYDWFKDFSFIDFAREAGKHLTVNYMMGKESVKKRLAAGSGISFTEFTYQLLQGWDFYHLYKEKNCRLQFGGSDQWGNIVTGTELIRRKAQGTAFAATCPLITKADGTKFGKTESGAVWLDAEKTSPYQFYQFWLNVGDEDAKKYIKIFTFIEKEEIDQLIAEHDEAPHTRILQKRLAEEVTRAVHGQEELDTAIAASNILFGKNVTEQLKSLNERTLLQVFEGVMQSEITKADLEGMAEIADLLSAGTQNQLFASKGEAKRMIKGGGISINKAKLQGSELPKDLELLQDKYILAQKGKKNYCLIKVV